MSRYPKRESLQSSRSAVVHGGLGGGLALPSDTALQAATRIPGGALFDCRMNVTILWYFSNFSLHHGYDDYVHHHDLTHIERFCGDSCCLDMTLAPAIAIVFLSSLLLLHTATASTATIATATVAIAAIMTTTVTTAYAYFFFRVLAFWRRPLVA